MALKAVTARRFARGKPVMDVPPVIGRDIARVDARRFDGIDQAEDLRNLGSAPDAEQHVTARIDLRQCGEGIARIDCTDDIERRSDRAIFVGGPADQREHLAGGITFDPLPAINNPVCNRLAELEPVFALALLPDQGDMSQLRSVAETCSARFTRRRVAVCPRLRFR